MAYRDTLTPGNKTLSRYETQPYSLWLKLSVVIPRVLGTRLHVHVSSITGYLHGNVSI